MGCCCMVTCCSILMECGINAAPPPLYLWCLISPIVAQQWIFGSMSRHVMQHETTHPGHSVTMHGYAPPSHIDMPCCAVTQQQQCC